MMVGPCVRMTKKKHGLPLLRQTVITFKTSHDYFSHAFLTTEINRTPDRFLKDFN